MEFIDTHTHLYDEAFASEEDAVVERAVAAGVSRMILPDIDSATRESMFALAERHPGVLFHCLGLHPTEVEADWETELEAVESRLEGCGCIAVGEVGLDLHWSRDFIEEQITVFKRLLEAAHRQDLPVIVHSREATDLTLDILKEYRHLNLRGVFHAYGGSIETYREIERLGDWYVGIGGVLTFKNAKIAETVRDIPLERILLETDAPYLTPVPYRGQRNESSYIPDIAAKLALQKGIDIAQVAEVTTSNAVKLFRL